MVRHGRLPVNLDSLRARTTLLENNVEDVSNQLTEVKQLLNAKEGKIAQLEQIYSSNEVPPWAIRFLEGIKDLRDSVEDLRNTVKDLDSRISKLEGQAGTESTEIQLKNKGAVKARIKAFEQAIEQQEGKKKDVWLEVD